MATLTQLYRAWLDRPRRVGYCHACFHREAVCHEETPARREYCSVDCVKKYQLVLAIPHHLATVGLGAKRLLQADYDRMASLPEELLSALLDLVLAERATDAEQFVAMWQLRTTSQLYRRIIDRDLIPSTQGLPDAIGALVRPEEFALFVGLHWLDISYETPYITGGVLKQMRLSHLHTLSLTHCRLDTEEVGEWHMPLLHRLEMGSCQLDGDYWGHFYRRLPGLTTLIVENNAIDVAALHGLAQLETLALSTWRYIDYAERIHNLDTLSRLQALRSLSLCNVGRYGDANAIDVDGALAPLTGLTQLRLLHIDQPVKRVLRDCTGLRELRITRLDDFSYSDVTMLQQLETLFIGGLWNSPVLELERLGALEQLRHLELVDFTGFTSEALVSLTQLEALLMRSVWQPVASEHLRLMTRLKTLQMDTQEVSPDEGLRQLTNLTALHINGSTMSDSALAPLRDLRTLDVPNSLALTTQAFLPLTLLSDVSIGNAHNIDLEELRLPPRCRVRYVRFYQTYDVRCDAEGRIPQEMFLEL